MLLLFLYRREANYFKSTIINGKKFGLQVAEDSPHYRTFLHCETILATEWLCPLIDTHTDTKKYSNIYETLLVDVGHVSKE